MLKKIAIVGTAGLPARYGGFETLTEHLTKNLLKQFDFTVFCSSMIYSERPRKYNGVNLKYLPFNANGVQSILYDTISIFRALAFAETILILGVSGCIVLPFVKVISKTPIIVNIDGIEWRREKWSWLAKKFLRFSEKLAVRYADKIISDNKVIQGYVRSEYGKTSELISYGGDHVKRVALSEEIILKYKFTKEPYAFTVCRIEPENNVHIILEAFSKCQSFVIAIVGNWNNSKYGIALKDNYKQFENIYLIDPIYDQRELDQLRSNSLVYVHGHSAGGTNPSLVEAMSLELPIIAYFANYNIETTSEKSMYFSDSLSLIDVLNDLRNEKVCEYAKEMKKIATDRYKWETIVEQYAMLLVKS